jgi:pyridoxine 4-dehydrogenase
MLYLREQRCSSTAVRGFHVVQSSIASLTRAHITSAEFYGQGLTTANLDLLARFFKKYPGYADRTFLSVKGGSIPGKLVSDGSRKNLRRSVDLILKALDGTKRLDLFEPARLDLNYDIEQYGEVLNEMVKEGKFDYIGLSAVGAETVRRAHKVRSLFQPLLIYVRMHILRT